MKAINTEKVQLLANIRVYPVTGERHFGSTKLKDIGKLLMSPETVAIKEEKITSQRYEIPKLCPVEIFEEFCRKTRSSNS